MHPFKILYRTTALYIIALFVLFPSNVQANRVACFHTNMGNFCIELFETHTPITTANFLNYINNDAYIHGIFHRSVPSFVIQGGGFKIIDTSDGKTLAPVTTFDPIKNEFKISNTRGTVAMAKLSGDPNSATSQWFVNLNDENSQNLDTQNGGFTVFGRIIFDGMLIFDAIEKLPIVNLGSSLSATPLVNYDNSQVLFSNFVQIDQVEVFDPTGVFSEGVASFAVDIGTSEALEVKLRLVQAQPSLIFELEPSSIVSLPAKPANIAIFSGQSGQLHIPSVMIDSSTIVKNVIMNLTDPQTYQFTLQHFE